ncbi:ribonuclease H-like protein [Cryphonectria parasitica EP155]|uniref:Ribonuclease n=1 Tax=Cryphonectria parasitica (strain ATCC 38755 / EP155) TaxID=660469 RepID=A0A9P4Y531_CRYP1|nr:ribonuclease H-like protein [Cryphonectria parasitica EP155]KAF3766290.1 ribonuclease H-like protein [Cryphonectria parasitica EP155]
MTDAADLETTSLNDIFIPPSVHHDALLGGDSYTHFSSIPSALLPSAPGADDGVPCCLGVDEAGRGPVLGPMVYGVFYLPLTLSDPLLRQEHHFDDSKVLTPAVRSSLMQKLCTPPPPSPPATTPQPAEGEGDGNGHTSPQPTLYTHTGWATTALSARSISTAMYRPGTAYNLNAQAMDATVALIRGVLARGVNVREIYVDTIGPPATYQKRLERFFPSVRVTVAKKADSLYPCVSAASVCAKVTRDACLEVLYEQQLARAGGGRGGRGGRGGGRGGQNADSEGKEGGGGIMAWGSGYPSDARCVSWMRANMHPLFGWGPECRFSWGTAKDMIEAKGGAGVKVEWPVEDDGETSRLTDFFVGIDDRDETADELGSWFGTPVALETF